LTNVRIVAASLPTTSFSVAGGRGDPDQDQEGAVDEEEQDRAAGSRL
jgi:site-specific DNA-cytosine methylase